jgi:ornithine carbamoyltransferase
MLEEIYNQKTNEPSDIHEHLPTLKRYAEECNHITEMGVRWIVSTYAFLMGKPDKLISIDIQHPNTWNADLSLVEAAANEINAGFEFILGDTLQIEIDETDLLFIDTWHAYKQLKAELDRHHNKAKKYIILHDTTSYEFKDETSYESLGWRGDGPGIGQAINEFLTENTEWVLHEKFTNNNGLTILKRI